MIQHQENEWLTWQRATKWVHGDSPLTEYPAPPWKLGNYYPEWFKNLKAEMNHYVPEVQDKKFTARVCLGLRGINSLGWTLTTGWPITHGEVQFHPEQMHGTPWAEKDSQGQYIWNLYLKTYPWRAKMKKGFRLLIADYPLEFSQAWHTFSGCVDANYRVNENQQLGSIYWFDEPIDPEYNYFNIETVIAIKKGCHIPSQTVNFVIVPVWDPEHTSVTGRYPTDNQ